MWTTSAAPRELVPASSPPRLHFTDVLALVAPSWRRQPLAQRILVRGIVERGGRQALQARDELGVRALHPALERSQAKRPQLRHRPRVEAIRVGQALEPLDAIGLAARDEPEALIGLLVAGQQMREHVLHRPPVLRARASDLGLGQ